MSTAVAPARPMRADARRNFEALLNAARTLLTERGSDVSMEEIAKAAGVGIGTLYRHFPRRIDMVEAVYSNDVDLLAATADAFADNPDALSALRTWLEGFVRYAETKRAFLTELHEAFEKNPELRLRCRETLDDAAGRVLGRAQQAGVVRGDLTGADLLRLVGGMCMAANSTSESNNRLLGVVVDGIATA